MDRLATALIRLGKFQEAVDWSIRAVDRSRTTPPNEVTTVLTNNLATLLMEQGDLEAAKRWAREAVATALQTTPLHHPNHELANTTLASIYAYRGDYARAEPISRSALFHLRRCLGESDVKVGLAAGNLAEIYRIQNRDREAIPLYFQAVAALGVESRRESWGILCARSGLMVFLSPIGRSAEAEHLASSVLKILQSTNAANDARAAILMQRMALLRLAQKDLAAARVAIERSLAIFEAISGAQSPQMIAPLKTYALILRAAKDRRSANRVDLRIRAITNAINGGTPSSRSARTSLRLPN
jgi:tetratricopeptide (TPR) repeat protein